MRDGEFGEIYMARWLCFKARDTIGKTPVSAVPPGVDYDLWTGPAPMHPFTKNRFHYNWHWFWDYGTGELGNWGAHMLLKYQDKDGSWSGQHCITGKTFCTSGALLVLMADRAPLPTVAAGKKDK